MLYYTVMKYCRLLCTPAYWIYASTVWSSVSPVQMFFIHSHHSNMMDTHPHPCHSVSHLSHSLRTMPSHYREAHKHKHTHTPCRICVTNSSKRWQSEPSDWQQALFFFLMTTQVLYWLSWLTYQSQIAQCTSLVVVRQCYALTEYLVMTKYLQGNSVNKFFITFWKCLFMLH